MSLPANSADLTNLFTSINAGNVSVDDGDYFVEFGSEYVMAEYKYRHINNTDIIRFVWRGRTTYATTISPLLIQIYNNNTLAWETLARETRQPADVDFELRVSQSLNLGNYYDSNKVIAMRVYQQVI